MGSGHCRGPQRRPGRPGGAMCPQRGPGTTRPSGGRADVPGSEGSGVRVLLVEDEIKMARAIRRGLEQEGDAVDAVGDGEEAIFQATELDYDAIVLDLMLPGVDGLSGCRSLRA